MKGKLVLVCLSLALLSWSFLGGAGDEGEKKEVQNALKMQEMDGNGDFPRVFWELSVKSHPWMEGSPSFVQLERHDDELPSICFIRGFLAGGREYARIEREGGGDNKGSLGIAAGSDQPSFAVTTYVLRDERLKMKVAEIRCERADSFNSRVKLIHSSRGFCYLGGVWGSWDNQTSCEVVLDEEDGFFYLTGEFGSLTGASAIIVEYPEGEAPKFEKHIEGFETPAGGWAPVVEWREISDDWQEDVEDQEIPDVQHLIDADEGICLLVGLSGGLQGGGEKISLKIDQEGRWYLLGQSKQRRTNAKVLILKYSESACRRMARRLLRFLSLRPSKNT